MAQTDLELLLDMGFEKARAELAVKKSGGLQGALQWLEDNQDKPLEEILGSEKGKQAADGEDEDPSNVAAEQEGEGAKSLVCNECGKRFRNADLAAYHASKTDHADFSESTDEIAPLTEEEKRAKLEELREKLKQKKANQAAVDREEQKRNEQIRMKSTKEAQDIKEDLQRKEQIKQAAKKRQEKLEDLEAKQRIKAKIEADKAERRRKAEEEKAAREGRLPGAEPAQAVPAAPAAEKTTVSRSEARLRLQTNEGNIMKTFPAETTLFEVAQMVESEKGIVVTSFTTTFPKRVYEGHLDFGKTLKEAGMVPSAALIVK